MIRWSGNPANQADLICNYRQNLVQQVINKIYMTCFVRLTYVLMEYWTYSRVLKEPWNFVWRINFNWKVLKTSEKRMEVCKNNDSYIDFGSCSLSWWYYQQCTTILKIRMVLFSTWCFCPLKVNQKVPRILLVAPKALPSVEEYLGSLCPNFIQIHLELTFPEQN